MIVLVWILPVGCVTSLSDSDPVRWRERLSSGAVGG
jgi:hypothetical protein